MKSSLSGKGEHNLSVRGGDLQRILGNSDRDERKHQRDAKNEHSFSGRIVLQTIECFNSKDTRRVPQVSLLRPVRRRMADLIGFNSVRRETEQPGLASHKLDL